MQTLSLTLQNAQVLRPDGVSVGDLSLHAGQIVDTCPGRQIDLSGFHIRPGIIDVHGDGFERHLAPRRGAMKDLSVGLAATEAELAANGITTAVLAQFWSWEGGMRGPDFALRMLQALERYDSQGTDMRVQLRFETHMLEDYAQIIQIVERHGIGFVVFNDHLPHDALDRGKRPPRLTGQALKGGRSPEAHLEMLKALHANGPQVPQAMAGLAERLAGMGVIMGSHVDRTPEARLQARNMGLRVSEFPETRVAAEAAAGAQRYAADHGIILVVPDTSPRGNSVADDESYDLGQGASFYLNATQLPWAEHFQMFDYVTKELPARINATFPTNEKQSISGHSMGGHGALICALKKPGFYSSVSAFSPICAPSEVPWGQKAFLQYLGEDKTTWQAWDSCALLKQSDDRLSLLVDQGEADEFLAEQLKPELLLQAANAKGHQLNLRMHAGYDHSYYFISSFIAEHIAFHAAALK